MSCNCNKKVNYVTPKSELGKLIENVMSGKLQYRINQEITLAYYMGKLNKPIEEIDTISSLSNDCLEKKIIELSLSSI